MDRACAPPRFFFLDPGSVLLSLYQGGHEKVLRTESRTRSQVSPRFSLVDSFPRITFVTDVIFFYGVVLIRLFWDVLSSSFFVTSPFLRALIPFWEPCAATLSDTLPTPIVQPCHKKAWDATPLPSHFLSSQ